MSASSELQKLVKEFREAQIRFEAEDFRLRAIEGGLLAEDLRHDPLGRVDLKFNNSGELGKLYFEESGPRQSWSKGFFFAVEPQQQTPSICEQTFVELSTRAAVHLPAAVQQKLRQFEPRGSSCTWWFAFLVTFGKDWSHVDELYGDGAFPILYEWTHPFLASANAIELGGLIDSSTTDEPHTDVGGWLHGHGEDPPIEFCCGSQPCGPISGTMEELGYALSPEGDRNVTPLSLRNRLQFAAKGKTPKIWLRKTGTRKMQAFFRSLAQSQSAESAVNDYRNQKSAMRHDSSREPAKVRDSSRKRPSKKRPGKPR